jgi:hypothetical protein
MRTRRKLAREHGLPGQAGIAQHAAHLLREGRHGIVVQDEIGHGGHRGWSRAFNTVPEALHSLRSRRHPAWATGVGDRHIGPGVTPARGARGRQRRVRRLGGRGALCKLALFMGGVYGCCAVAFALPGGAGILAVSRSRVRCSDEVASAVSLRGRCALDGRGLTFFVSTKKVSKESDPCGALGGVHSQGGGFLFRRHVGVAGCGEAGRIAALALNANPRSR